MVSKASSGRNWRDRPHHRGAIAPRTCSGCGRPGPVPRHLTVPPIDFAAVREELDIPLAFAPAVEAAAAEAARTPRLPTVDATDIELVTVDPTGSMDLDQALHIGPRPGGGYRVHYAIADVAAFVVAGDPVDVEARQRGVTLYSPDRRTPLHPTIISEGAASLLPGQDRPALLWRIDLDGEGRQETVDVRRALVRSRARLDYAGLQASIDAGRPPAGARRLAEVGRLRQTLAAERDAIELDQPDQDVVPDGSGHWALVLRAPLPVEQWNAELSLLTGMAAAGVMLEGGIGLLRTLPEAEPGAVARLRASAGALGIRWTAHERPGEVIRRLDRTLARDVAFLEEAAGLLRGAGYTSFSGTPPDLESHAGIGAPYAHVTAPIRRLCDRFTSEVCLALSAGSEIPEWAATALPQLPDIMAAADRRARTLERAVIDLTEAWLLAPRLGEVFDATVINVDERGTTIVIDRPPVRARCEGTLAEGKRVRVRLETADVTTRTVRFRPA